MSFLRLSFDITSACNLKCSHCMRLNKEDVDHFPVDVFEKVIKQAKSYGTRTIIFTGGEPLLHPNIFDMVDMLVKEGFSYYIVTNATRTDKIIKLVEDRERCAKLETISISLEGATEETCDKIRGKGVYRKLMATTAFLQSRGLPFGYKLSVNTLNLNELDQYVLDAAKLGAKYIEFSHMHPTPELLKAGMILPKSEWKKIESTIARYSKIVRIKTSMCMGGYCAFPLIQCSSMQMSDIHVDCRANLSLCCVLPYMWYNDPEKDKRGVAGNLAEMDLWDAHKRLVAIIAGLNQSKINKLRDGTFSELDYYPCNYCLKYFGKMEWLKELDPDNTEWAF